jgi:predicted ATP-binding protein involved in virulence
LPNPQLGNPLDGAGVVLIDELELHSHPRWQREVVEKLRTTFPNIQFIATTHSPFVIQSLRPGELINLDPEEFGEYSDKSIEDIAETVMGVELPQKSERYQRMMEAAEQYFTLLREMPLRTAEDIRAAEERLNELAAPFSDDPAFQALLKLERESQTRPGGNASR